MVKISSVAIIDIGSNSIKLLVATRSADGHVTALAHRTIDARISAGISRAAPRLSEDGMRRGAEAIHALLADAAPFAPAHCVLVATSAVRDAHNGADFISRVHAATGHTIVRREPVGVVAAIVPWNYPQALAAFKLAPALAAGCTVVLKASPETALDAMVFAEAAQECGLPAGVLNVVPGGVEPSSRLVSHPGVDKVSFTGSTAVGRIIAETCGRLLRPVLKHRIRDGNLDARGASSAQRQREVGCALRYVAREQARRDGAYARGGALEHLTQRAANGDVGNGSH